MITCRSRGGRRRSTYAFDGEPAVKDAIEAVGVPHPEVDAIVVNDVPVWFAHRMRDGDRVEVYPQARSRWPRTDAGCPSPTVSNH